MSEKIFLCWGAVSARTRRIASTYPIKVVLFRDRPPYFIAFIKTILYMLKNRPKIVFLQLPQGPLLLLSTILKRFLKFLLIADTHTAFLYTITIKEKLLNKPFIKFLKYVDIIIIHNYLIKNLIPKEFSNKTIVLEDPITLDADLTKKVEEHKIKVPYIIFPSSFSHDEPFLEVFKTMEIIKERRRKIFLIITGNWKKMKKIYFDGKKVGNILFTGFLPPNIYYSLIKNSKAVLALTNREYTLLSSAIEGIFFNKPIIISKTKTLKKLFGDGPFIFVNNSYKDLLRGIEKILHEDKYWEIVEGVKKFKKLYNERVSRKYNKLFKLLERFSK